MPIKLSRLLKDRERTTGAAPAVGEYEERYRAGKDGGLESRKSDYRNFTDLYYDLVTDFYEYGWGRSFHFAPRVPGESFKASLARHEHYLAHKLGLGPGMVAADLGCGIGGPLLEITRFSGARIVGVNSNGYQLDRARRYAQEAGLAHLVEFLHCDFLHVNAPDESFDAVYSIEATCCAPDKPSIYGEVFRLLKPGAGFANYEYYLTDRFDPEDPHHLRIKADIELGGCSRSTTGRRSMTRFDRWGSRCWKRGTLQCRPARRSRGTNRWPVQAYPWPVFAARRSDVWSPPTR